MKSGSSFSPRAIVAVASATLVAAPLAAATLAAATLAGCVLLVSPEQHGASCRFQGEDTTCGRCLTTLCQGELNAACFDDSVIGPVEQCAARGDDACDSIPASAVRTCLKAQCPSTCYARTGTSLTRCSDSFAAPGLACSCQSSLSSVNDVACNTQIYPRTRCCAPRAWPGPALECNCNAVSCVPSSDGCICTLTDNLDSTAAEDCHGGAGDHCCAIQDRCQCRPRACAAGEREVAACSKSELTCPDATTEVASCSIRQ